MLISATWLLTSFYIFFRIDIIYSYNHVAHMMIRQALCRMFTSVRLLTSPPGVQRHFDSLYSRAFEVPSDLQLRFFTGGKRSASTPSASFQTAEREHFKAGPANCTTESTLGGCLWPPLNTYQREEHWLKWPFFFVLFCLLLSFNFVYVNFCVLAKIILTEQHFSLCQKHFIWTS